MKGDWIKFPELCARVPEYSASTLRRMYQARQISSRQRTSRSPREFNWLTVQAELAALEKQRRGAPIDAVPPSVLSEFTAELRALRAEVAGLREQLTKGAA